MSAPRSTPSRSIPDGATVTRLITRRSAAGDTTLIARDFPPGLDPASLRVEGESGARRRPSARSMRARRAPERPPTAPELEKRIEALRDERAALDDKIAAETARKQFAERFAAQRAVRPRRKGRGAPARRMARRIRARSPRRSRRRTTRSARRGCSQREIDRELARLESALKANPPRKMEVRIDLAANAPARATFRVSYTVRGARWAPLYDARLDSGTRERKPALELIRRAEIVQQTGEDWSDVALSVSTVRTAKGGSAPELRPLIVRYPQPAAPRSATGSRVDAGSRAERRRRRTLGSHDAERVATSRARLRPRRSSEAAVETGGYQARLPRAGPRVGRDQRGREELSHLRPRRSRPTCSCARRPRSTRPRYLEASFKHAEEAPLLPGRVSLYRDGIFVGRGQMALTPKDETVRLGFGADDKVKVARAITRKIEGSAGIISSAKTDEREFKITVRSGHERPIRVVDRGPGADQRDRRDPGRNAARSRRRRASATCATGAACSPGASRPRPARPRRSSSAGGCAGPATRSVAYEPRRP